MNPNSSVLLIYTGGTIGMMEDPLSGELKPVDFAAIRDYIPELNRFKLHLAWRSLSVPIDSSNCKPQTWRQIVELISSNYDDYDGFVVLHGTDTMSFTASALSFMLENLTKPVILTGSQLPLGRLRTDGKENLITAIEIAGTRQEDGRSLNEVCIFFEDQLFRGNRTFKYNTEDFDAFDSPNYPNLANAGIHIHYKKQYFLPKPSQSMVVRKNMDSNLAVLTFFPGITQNYAESVAETPGVRAIILHTYGSGNVPDFDWLERILMAAKSKGVILVNVSQCKQGFVEQGRYATSAVLSRCKVWSAGDMTLEATITKLMYLIGAQVPPETLEFAFHDSLRGERTTFTSLV